MKNIFRNSLSCQLNPQVNHCSIHSNIRITAPSPLSGNFWHLLVLFFAATQTSILDLLPPPSPNATRILIPPLSCDSPALLQPTNSLFNLLQDRCRDLPRKTKFLLSHAPPVPYLIDPLLAPLYLFTLSSLQAHIRSFLFLWKTHRGATWSFQCKNRSHHRDVSSQRPSRRLLPAVQRELNIIQAWISDLNLTAPPQDSKVITRLRLSYTAPFPPLISAVFHFPELVPSSLRTALCSPSFPSRYARRSFTLPINSSLLTSSYHSLVQLPSFLRPTPFLYSSSASLFSLEMVENQDHNAPVNHPENKEQPENPLDRVITNSGCTLCKTHCFMIARFVKHFNELKDDFQADSRA